MVPLVHCVTDNVSVLPSISDYACQTTKATLRRIREHCQLVNHFIDNSCCHTLSDLKFILIEQVATKTEKFLEYREGYWQAQLWTYEPYGFNAKTNSIQGDVANF